MAQSTSRQNCSASSRPAESVDYTVSNAGSYYVGIYRSAGSGTHRLDLLSHNHELPYRVAANSLWHPGDSASQGMITVGAVGWYDPTTLEVFSSEGPTTDGRTKPELGVPMA